MSQNTVETIFKYNGVEYAFDIRNADHAERFENAYDELLKEEKKIPKDGKPSALARAQIKMIKGFFDTVLGEGAGDDLCGKEPVITAAYDAYAAFCQYVEVQNRDIKQKKAMFATSKNRKQRRANES